MFGRLERDRLQRHRSPARPCLRALQPPLVNERWTYTTRASRSTSRHSSASHSAGRKPVAAAKITIGDSAPRDSRRRHRVRPTTRTGGRCSLRRGDGLSTRASPGRRRSFPRTPGNTSDRVARKLGARGASTAVPPTGRPGRRPPSRARLRNRGRRRPAHFRCARRPRRQTGRQPPLPN